MSKVCNSLQCSEIFGGEHSTFTELTRPGNGKNANSKDLYRRVELSQVNSFQKISRMHFEGGFTFDQCPKTYFVRVLKA